MIGTLLFTTLTAAAEPGELLTITGFVQPSFLVQVTPAAVERDRLTFGLRDSKAGITFAGQPLPQWRYKAFLSIGAPVSVVRDVSFVDTNDNGFVNSVDIARTSVVSDIVREISVTWAPTGGAQIRAGQMPVPLTATAQSADARLLFPNRANPNRRLLADDDLGVLFEAAAPEGIVSTKIGVFNGRNLPGRRSSQRGLAYLARVELAPLGELSYDEVDPLRSEVRFSLGAAVIWNPYRVFDSVGFSQSRVDDIRGSVSARLSLVGFTLSAEALHRYQLDTLSERPVIATGAYTQASWKLPGPVEPIGRIGWVAEDRSFDPRTTVWGAGGVNVYPAFGNEDPSRRDKVRFGIVYEVQRRVTEGETIQGAQAFAVVRFD
ncbi:MAG: hypothetical protein AAF211_07630 [Myxococcota bacterium]